MAKPTQLQELGTVWMRNSLVVTGVNRRRFALGPASEDEIITTNRFILVLKGKMDYTIEGRTIRIRAGTQFLVPAWVRRVWSVPRGGICETVWCEFDDGGMESGWSYCRRRKLDKKEFFIQKKKYLELLKLYHDEEPRDRGWRQLQAEAELKTLLIRFLEKSENPLPENGKLFPAENAAAAFHPEVKRILKWLAAHFTDKDVLGRLYMESGMSRNYFRKLFVKAMQCAPHVHIERLRLRHARYLLREYNWPVKQVSDTCGYADALYFSRIYHRFWGHPPGRDRS